MPNYKININKHADMFKALGNPHRLAIFQRLINCCEPGTICNAEAVILITVGEIGEDLEIAPSTISHHLKELRQAGLIQTRRKGKNIECWVEPDVLNQLATFFTL